MVHTKPKSRKKRKNSSSNNLLTDSYKQDAALCLASAFINDPVLGQHMFRQDCYKASGATTFFSYVIDKQFKNSIDSCISVDEKGKLQGVALWKSPDEHPGMPMSVMLQMITNAPSIFGYSHIWRALMAGSAVDDKHPKYKHYYLAFIGVSPFCQGKGIGSALLQPVFTKADKEGVPCYLETGNPSNIFFYEKYGFKVVKEVCVMSKTELPVGSSPVGAPLIVYCMKREPAISRKSRRS
jgi:ribosomal protein S18 acetylase RimI-like enzyme